MSHWSLAAPPLAEGIKESDEPLIRFWKESQKLRRQQQQEEENQRKQKEQEPEVKIVGKSQVTTYRISDVKYPGKIFSIALPDNWNFWQLDSVTCSCDEYHAELLRYFKERDFFAPRALLCRHLHAALQLPVTLEQLREVTYVLGSGICHLPKSLRCYPYHHRFLEVGLLKQ